MTPFALLELLLGKVSNNYKGKNRATHNLHQQKLSEDGMSNRDYA